MRASRIFSISERIAEPKALERTPNNAAEAFNSQPETQPLRKETPLSTGSLLQMQHLHGNRHVSRMLADRPQHIRRDGEENSESTSSSSGGTSEMSSESSSPNMSEEPNQSVLRWTQDDGAMLVANTRPGVMTAFQASRVEAAINALSDADYQTFRGLLDSASSDLERGFLCKALAANRSIGDIQTFAGTISGMSDRWLMINLNVVNENVPENPTSSDPDNQGIMQQYGNSCGPTSVQVIHAQADPIYALELRSAGPIDQAADNAVTDPTSAPNSTLAAEQNAILTNHATAGTGNMPTNRSNPAGGAWVESDMNAFSSATGITYQTQIVGTAISLADAVAVIQQNLTNGVHVPLVVGASAGDTKHYVVAMIINGDMIQIHDVWTGDTVWRSVNDFTNSTLNLPSGWNALAAVDVPSPVQQPPPVPATP